MKKRILIVVAFAGCLLLGALYLWGPSVVPTGQQPLIVLSSANLTDFTAVFDAASDAPRMVLLLSPT